MLTADVKWNGIHKLRIGAQFGMECPRKLMPTAPYAMGHSWDSWRQKAVTNLHEQ